MIEAIAIGVWMLGPAAYGLSQWGAFGAFAGGMFSMASVVAVAKLFAWINEKDRQP